MKHLHTLTGFVAIVASVSAALFHSTSVLAGQPQELNAYTFPSSKVVGIPGACRMIRTGSNPEKEAECAEWGRKFRENGKRRYNESSTTPTTTSRKPVQTLSCYTTGGVYSNLGDCR
ncbi:hypothetical protein AB3R30_16805 [Leptolyngbyaceae cyanobacterium UHCC 1019]